MEASCDGPAASGVRTTVTNDIFSSTKVRNARNWLPSRQQELCLLRPGCHQADIFFPSGSRDLGKSLGVRNHCGLRWLLRLSMASSHPAVPPLETTPVLSLQVTRPWPSGVSAMPPACASSPASCSCSCLVSSLHQGRKNALSSTSVCLKRSHPARLAGWPHLSGAFPDPPPEETALPGNSSAPDPADLSRLHVSLTQLQPLRGQGPTSAMLVRTWYMTRNQSIFAEAMYLPSAL